MEFKQIWANLAVENIEITEKFYQFLGLKSNMKKPNSSEAPEMTSFLFGKSGFIIHFFKKDQLEFAMNGKAADTTAGNEIIFSISAETEEEVNLWAEKAKEAGGIICKEAKRQENGYYYCVFADPDGHKFNVLLVEKGM